MRIGQGNKQTRQQQKKMKKNQAQQKSVLKEAEAKKKAAESPPPQSNNSQIAQRVREPMTSYAEKLLMQKQRPVLIDNGHLYFAYPGFEPFKMHLSCIYVLLEGFEMTSRGRKVWGYDGNGHCLAAMMDSSCLMCQNCDVDTKKHSDENNKSVIHEIELCAGHIQERFTSQGFSLPTKRDLTPPKGSLKIHLPSIRPVKLSEDNVTLHRARVESFLDGVNEKYGGKGGYLTMPECGPTPPIPQAEKTEFDDIE